MFCTRAGVGARHCYRFGRRCVIRFAYFFGEAAGGKDAHDSHCVSS